MQWLEITVRVNQDNRELVLYRMLELGAGGVQECDPGVFLSLQAQLPEECRPERMPNTECNALIGYWQANEQGRQVVKEFQELVGAEQVTVREISDEAWLSTNSIGFAELLVGNRWVIYPEKPAVMSSDRFPIYLRPGQAFGTGLHPTTQLCLELLEEVPVAGKALDAGTGSGILTIALSRLGFTDLVACDIDPIAVEVAKANLAANEVRADVRCADPAVLPEGGFSLIVANILAEVICELAPVFVKLSNPGAGLITSGIVSGKSPQVEMVLCQQGYRIIKKAEKENWVAYWAQLGGEQ